MYVIIWEFESTTARQSEFERAYGPAGDWAKLFQCAPGYLGTELLRCSQGEARYFTLDRWDVHESFAAFQQNHAREYETLDERCEGLTVRETRIGGFGAVE